MFVFAELFADASSLLVVLQVASDLLLVQTPMEKKSEEIIKEKGKENLYVLQN
jgi:competence protein ComGC